MDDIQRSAAEIAQIINVIDGIAFQTNLLALNAGVEAARAGDAGKGFAVVASEVRALAQRSADAAKHIKDLIGESSKQVARGVALVGQSGEALDRIVGKVAEIATLAANISQLAQVQSNSLQQVNIAIGEMDATTQQNAAMVEESTAAARSLASEADQLTGLVARFTLDDAMAPPARPAVAKPIAVAAPRPPVRAARRAAAAISHSPSRRRTMTGASSERWSCHDEATHHLRNRGQAPGRRHHGDPRDPRLDATDTHPACARLRTRHRQSSRHRAAGRRSERPAGWDAIAPSPRHVIIVIQIGEQMHGLVVDSVNDIVTIEPAALQPPPDLGGGSSRHLSGLIAVDDRW